MIRERRKLCNSKFQFLGSTSTMRLDLFSKGDSVLLLGEGNFSFSVSLHKHKLPIKIVATSFSHDLEFENQLKNIEYLKSHKVPVFLNVDATNIIENNNFSDVKFSKIIFNFPHRGGKMKIHLNRLLLRKVFENCNKIITKNGRLIVSLCQGQGGTPADQPQRKWNDSWQVTEMAAHGDFVLTDVEPFLCENFPEYQCIGYRGQDVKFHLKGALVHVFAKRESPYPSITESVVVRRMDLAQLKQSTNVLVPVIYAELYQKNPIANPDSPISYFKRLVIDNFTEISSNLEWKYLDDNEIPVYVESGTGVPCLVDSAECSLRSTPLEILPHFLKLLMDNSLDKKKFLFFPGMYFNSLGVDFLNNAPVEFQFVIAGENLLINIEKFLNRLICLFKNKNVKVLQRRLGKEIGSEKFISVNSLIELVLESPENETPLEAALLYNVHYEGVDTIIGVIKAQVICQYFFQVGWREIWADEAQVLINGKPTFKQSLLYPSSYQFDITLRYNEMYSEERFYKLLWLAAGQLIEKVENVNEYTSVKGWSSKCYRITYRSLDRPLYRKKVVDIHSKVVGRALELGLKITVS